LSCAAHIVCKPETKKMGDIINHDWMCGGKLTGVKNTSLRNEKWQKYNRKKFVIAILYTFPLNT